ncbi:uncharacterized protein LOC143624762 [Bidens hawaiensis]|uniref:uncharacterized protein LOC143624762 n=1 Tax=Bidens hawaiensis TaxID=980011 RepID=UPI00404B241D
MFKGEALEWWNTLIDVKGRNNLYNLEWRIFNEVIKQRLCPIHEVDQIQTKLWNHKVIGTNIKEYNTKFLEYCRLVPHLVTPKYNKVTRYIYGLPKEIRDHVRSHMPATTESAIKLAGYLMECMIRNHEEERKVVIEKKQENDGKKKFEKGREGSSVFNRALCKNCGRRHEWRCLKPTPKGHFSAECTKKKPTTGGANGSGARTDNKRGNARAFMLNTQKAGELPDVITGTFPINNVYARVLFDSGANQRFIDYKFCNLLNEPIAKLNNQFEVETTNGNLIQISEVLSSFISLAGYKLPVQLLPMELAGFDVILGMDWLAANQARILCNEKAIDLLIPNRKII